MKQLIESFLAEDNTGNQYRINCYQDRLKANGKITVGEPYYQYKNSSASPMGDGLYYLPVLDTEVMRIS